jgi:hypothetical protein
VNARRLEEMRLTFHTLFYAIFMNFHLFYGEIKVL